MMLADAIMSNVFEVRKQPMVMNDWLNMDLFHLPFYFFFLDPQRYFDFKDLDYLSGLRMVGSYNINICVLL